MSLRENSRILSKTLHQQDLVRCFNLYEQDAYRVVVFVRSAFRHVGAMGMAIEQKAQAGIGRWARYGAIG
jgi:hypothetical protein